jgi:hypothetical protein
VEDKQRNSGKIPIDALEMRCCETESKAFPQASKVTTPQAVSAPFGEPT